MCKITCCWTKCTHHVIIFLTSCHCGSSMQPSWHYISYLLSESTAHYNVYTHHSKFIIYILHITSCTRSQKVIEWSCWTKCTYHVISFLTSCHYGCSLRGINTLLTYFLKVQLIMFTSIRITSKFIFSQQYYMYILYKYI